MAKTYKFREIVRALKELDSRFEIFADQGKGSHRTVYHPDINGEPKSFPLTCHGDNTDIGTGLMAAFRRRFNLSNDFPTTSKKAQKVAKKAAKKKSKGA